MFFPLVPGVPTLLEPVEEQVGVRPTRPCTGDAPCAQNCLVGGSRRRVGAVAQHIQVVCDVYETSG